MPKDNERERKPFNTQVKNATESIKRSVLLSVLRHGNKRRPWELNPVESAEIIKHLDPEVAVQYVFTGCELAVDKDLLTRVINRVNM